MNILYIGSSSDWHIDLWVRYFASRHSVFLFSDKEDYLDDQPFEGVEIVESGGLFGRLLNSISSDSHLLFQLNKFASARQFGRELDKVIVDKKIDIVHAHNLYYGYLTSFMTVKVPVVFTPMGSDIIIHAQSNTIYRYMAKKAFARADVVTGDSALLQSRGLIVGAKPENNYIIQNGVDSRIFRPKKASLKAHYNIEADETLLFSPRAITPLYNIDTILNSIAILKAKGLRVRCMFSYAFGGEYLDSLYRQIERLSIQSNVIWLGRLAPDEMAEHYNASDIVVSVPSSDSSPKSVYEAMFCGKPVVISNLPWSHEILSDNDCMRVGIRDAESLANAISLLVADPELSRRISASATVKSRKYYDYDENMRSMEQIMLAELEPA